MSLNSEMESDSQILSTPSQDRDYATSAHFNKAHTHYKRDHHHDEHIEYDPNMKVEFVPPVEGTPAALALAGMKYTLQPGVFAIFLPFPFRLLFPELHSFPFILQRTMPFPSSFA